MLLRSRPFTLTLNFTGGASAGIAVLQIDGSLLVQPDRGPHFIVHGLAEAVLEENAAYLEWREAQGGTPGALPIIESPDLLDETGEHPSTGLGNDDELEGEKQ